MANQKRSDHQRRIQLARARARRMAKDPSRSYIQRAHQVLGGPLEKKRWYRFYEILCALNGRECDV